jgi:hypothetical protein
VEVKGLRSPFGIAIDAQNRVWVSNSQSDMVLRFPANDPSKVEYFRAGIAGRGVALDSKGTCLRERRVTMRSALLLSLGLALLVATANHADDKTSKEDPKQAPQQSKDSYVKVRVEVEVRGVLSHTEKATTVTARYPVFELWNDAKELADAAATPFSLDFDRARDLRELAKVLSGKEVVVTGMCELRMVTQQARPGGGQPFPFPAPTWSLQRSVLVTGLKSAGEK